MWVLHCDKVSKFVSESMDRDLSFTERMSVRVHLLMCRHCARFAKQLEHMRSVIRKESSSQKEWVYESICLCVVIVRALQNS